jgi:hypothetical protein
VKRGIVGLFHKVSRTASFRETNAMIVKHPAIVMGTGIIAAAASSVEIPISGTYGSATTCALYAAGGGNAVFSGGASLGQIIVSSDAPDYLIVSRTEVVGYEWACEPEDVAGQSVTLQCPGPQVSTDLAEPETVTATVEENLAQGTLSYVDENGTVILTRCPQQ